MKLTKEQLRKRQLSKLILLLEALEQTKIKWPEPLPPESLDEYPE